MTPSKAAFLETAFFEESAGTARAEIVSAELFLKDLVAMDDPFATLHLRFGREAFATLAHGLKKMTVHQSLRDSGFA